MIQQSTTTALTLALLGTITLLTAGANALPARLKFGCHAPMTGLYGEIGQLIRDGVLAAFNEVNTAGGLRGGTMLDFVIADDQYVATQTPGALQSLVAEHPDIVALVAGVGTVNTAYAYPLLEALGLADVGPVTGSSIFRTTFREKAINIRSGYDNEVYTILNLLLSVKRVRRIAIFYQADGFGAPMMEKVLEVMPVFGLEPVAVVSNPGTFEGLATYNFTAAADEIERAGAEGVVMLVTGFWLRDLMARLQPRRPNTVYVTGSWIGSGILTALPAVGIDMSTLFVTQTFPIPTDTSYRLIQRYRAALFQLNGTSAQYDQYFTLEGYVAARLAIEIANRTFSGTRQEFLDTVYSTRMFGIDDLVAGPFERECQSGFDTVDPARGRSALCRCSQGLRVVKVSAIEQQRYVPYPQGTLTFSLADCYPTAATGVAKVAVVGVLVGNSSEFNAAAATVAHGFSLPNYVPAVRTMNFSDSSTFETASAYLNLTAIAMPVGVDLQQLDSRSEAGRRALVVDPVTVPQLPWGTAFDESVIAVGATLERQLYAAAEHMRQKVPGEPLHLLVSDRVVDPAAVGDVQRLFADTLRTVGGVASGVVRRGLPLTASSLDDAFGSAVGAVYIVGITTDAEMAAVLGLLTSNIRIRVFVSFDELAVTYNAVLRCVQDAASCGSVNVWRMHYSSNVASWLNSTESFMDPSTADYVRTSGASLATAHPLGIRSFQVAQAMAQVTERMGRMTPTGFVDALYGLSLLPVAGGQQRFGPYSNTPCAGSDECRCNVGAGVVVTRSLWPLMELRPTTTGATTGQPPTPSTSTATQFTTCRIEYVQVPVEETSYLALAICLPLATVIVMIVVFLVVRHLGRANRFAPQNPNQPLAMAYLALRGLADLDETDPKRTQMFKRFGDHVRRTARKHQCHVAHKVGDFFVVVNEDAGLLAHFVDAVYAEFDAQNWDVNQVVESTRNADGTICSVGTSAEGKGSRSNSRMPSRTHSAEDLHANSTHLHPGGGASMRKSSEGKRNVRAKKRESLAPDCRTTQRGSAGPVRRHRLVGHLTIALHVGRCVIDHDEHTDTFEYRGQALTTCALLLDACVDGQCLATDGFQESLMDALNSDCDLQLSSPAEEGLSVQAPTGDKVPCLQYNPVGVVKSFAKKKGEEQLESAAAAAQQATGLLARKRITVAAIRVGALANVQDRTSDAITGLNNSVFEHLSHFASVHRGHVHLVFGDLIIVSFNAARPTSEQGRRALQLCNDTIDGFVNDRPGGRVTCGVAFGYSHVGAAPNGSVSIVGPVLQEAMELEAACRRLPATVEITVADEQEFSKTAALQWVDLLPFSSSPVHDDNDGGMPPRFPRRGVLSVDELHNDADEGEWLYLLEQREGRSKALNDAFREFASTGDAARALAAAEAIKVTEEDSPAEFLAHQRLLRISRAAAAGSGCVTPSTSQADLPTPPIR